MPLSSQHIYDHYIAARRSSALTVAVHLGLFDLLQTPQSFDILQDTLALSKRGLRGLLRSLVAMDLIVENDSLFQNTAESNAFLVSTQPHYIGGLIEMDFENFLTPTNLLQAMREDRPTVYGDVDVWNSHQDDREQARHFTAAMQSISIQPAEALSLLSEWQSVTHLIDMGAGSGVFGITLLQRYPQMTASICDLPMLETITGEYLTEANVTDRATFVGLDMFNQSWPSGDAVLLSQILHDWNFKECQRLLKRAFSCLEPNGTIFIHEKLTNQQHKPLANALVNLDMLIWTNGQQFSFTELKNLLETAGFVEVTCRPTIDYWSVVTARKP